MKVNQRKIAWTCRVLIPSTTDTSGSTAPSREAAIVSITTGGASSETNDTACILIAISMILQIMLMVIPISKFLDKPRDTSASSMNLDYNEFESEIFLFFVGSNITYSIVVLIESIRKYCNLKYFYTSIKIIKIIQTLKTQLNICVLIATTSYSNIMAMNNIKIEYFGSGCNYCYDITYLLIACCMDIKFSKNYHYSLWCRRCLEYKTYTIPIEQNFISFIIEISNKTVRNIYNILSLSIVRLTNAKQKNTKSKKNKNPSSTIMEENLCDIQNIRAKAITEMDICAKITFLDDDC